MELQHISLTLADLFSLATLSQIFDRPTPSIDLPDDDDEKPEPGTHPNDE